MAYEIWDGFDHYDAAHELWDTAAGTPLYSTSYARFTALPNCVGKGVSFNNASKRKNLSGNRNTLIVSTAFQISSLSFSGRYCFLDFQDNGTIQTNICVASNGALQVVNPFGQVLQGQTSPGVIVAGVYYFLDIVITFGGSGSGACSLYVSTPAGGAATLALTGINTIVSSNAYANQVGIGDLFAVLLACYFDDFHCHTNTGASPNAVLGEGTRIHTKMPNGAGFATTFTPNGASANWQCVDDVPPDDDTTYVSTGTYPSTEGYAIGTAGFTGTVNGVVRKSRLRKDDAGAHTFQNGVRSSTTNTLQTAVSVTSSYSWDDGGCITQDPNTSAAWTAAGADAAQPIISAAS